MKRRVLLLVAALVPLVLVANPVASREDQGELAYGRRAGPDSDRWGSVGGYGSPSGESSYFADRDQGRRPGDQTGTSIPAPRQAPGAGGFVDRNAGEAERPYGASDREAAGYRWPYSPGPVGPVIRGGGYSGPPPTSGQLPPLPPAEYRFRGGETFRPDSAGVMSLEDAYRFRPLTEQERERMQSDGRWRPPDPDQPAGVREGPGVTPIDEAYGYQSDDWFRRNYGDRP